MKTTLLIILLVMLVLENDISMTWVTFYYSAYGVDYPNISLWIVSGVGMFLGWLIVPIVCLFGKHPEKMEMRHQIAFQIASYIREQKWISGCFVILGGLVTGCTWHAAGVDYQGQHPKQAATVSQKPETTHAAISPIPLQPLSVGDNSVVMGNVTGSVGSGSVVIGPTDDRGNTIIDTPITVGAGAHGSPGSITIGAGASIGPTSSGSQSPAIVNLTVSGPGAVGVNYGNMTTNKIANATLNITYNGPSTSTPSITLDGKWLEKNSVQPNGQYLTRGLITINSPYVVGTLDVEATGETIKGFIVSPVGRTGSMGEMGIAGKTYFRKIYSASGQYVFMIFSSSPEEFQIHFRLEN